MSKQNGQREKEHELFLKARTETPLHENGSRDEAKTIETWVGTGRERRVSIWG
jgi:hypothetical protein